MKLCWGRLKIPKIQFFRSWRVLGPEPFSEGRFEGSFGDPKFSEKTDIFKAFCRIRRNGVTAGRTNPDNRARFPDYGRRTLNSLKSSYKLEEACIQV